MLIDPLRQKIRSDLEVPAPSRQFGSGWISGVAAVIVSAAALFFVLCLRYPALLAVPPLREHYETAWFRLVLHGILIGGFSLAILNLVLRPNKILGFTALFFILVATLLGGSHVESHGASGLNLFFGLDWFVLNVLFTGLLFVPIEKLFPHRAEQGLFRTEWREDLFYYFISSVLVQSLTFISMAPALAMTAHTQWTTWRHAMAAQPIALQVFEIMFLTDLVQYWVHRAFHRIPFLWGFHAVHHAAESMDWLASARMHVIEVIVLRGATVMPMYIMGYDPLALGAYILLVYVHSSLLHANFGWNFDRIGPFLATPRFHHWHHGKDKEAIDVNFAIHFPLLDRLFGTYHLPKGEWPKDYGITSSDMPRGYFRQFLYPFVRQRKSHERPPPPEAAAGD